MEKVNDLTRGQSLFRCSPFRCLTEIRLFINPQRRKECLLSTAKPVYPIPRHVYFNGLLECVVGVEFNASDGFAVLLIENVVQMSCSKECF